MRNGALLAGVVLVAGCGGSESGGETEPVATATRTAASETGGPATLEPDDPVSADAALAVLREARWASETAAGGAGFTITPAKGYEKQASSVGLVYTLDGDSGPGVAQFLVQESKGAGVTPAGGRRDAARARFAGLPGSPEPTTEREVEIAGLPGVELTGAGTEDGSERRYYAAMLFTDDGYVLLVGIFDPDRYPADQTRAFRSMAHSFR